MKLGFNETELHKIFSRLLITMPRSVDTWVNRDHEPNSLGWWGNETREERTEKKMLAVRAEANKKHTGISRLRIQKLKGKGCTGRCLCSSTHPFTKSRGKRKGASKIAEPIGDVSTHLSQAEDSEMSLPPRN